MIEEPLYIPRKFRNDNTFCMNDNEKSIYDRLALSKMQTEMQVLTSRREFFRNKLDIIDESVMNHYFGMNIPKSCHGDLKEMWEKECLKVKTKIDNIWAKKVDGMKEAYKRDKERMAKSNSDEEVLITHDSRSTGSRTVSRNFSHFHNNSHYSNNHSNFRSNSAGHGQHQNQRPHHDQNSIACPDLTARDYGSTHRPNSSAYPHHSKNLNSTYNPPRRRPYHLAASTYQSTYQQRGGNRFY